MNVEEIVQALQLVPLDQEGGWFRQTLLGDPVPDSRLPGAQVGSGTRPRVTAIHALIGGSQFSAMHRLRNDEIWFFHMGDPLDMLLLKPDGSGETVTLGHGITRGEKLQHVVPAGVWQGSTGRARAGGEGYSLVSCVMVPGFVWTDFELGARAELIASHPGFAAEIEALTRIVAAKGHL
jgi:hypothetical protein